MKDNHGYLAIADGIMAIAILFSAFLVFNMVLEIPDTDYTTLSFESTKAQDVMQQLSANINVTDKTFLEEISEILEENGNSKRGITEAGKLSEAKLDGLGLKDNYLLRETNFDMDIVEKGSFKSSADLSVAGRNCGKYCFRLYVW